MPPARFIARTLALALTLAASAYAAADTRLDGTWKPAQAEIGGQALPDAVLKTIVLKVDGLRYSVVVETEKGPAVDKGSFTLDTSTTPKAMTIRGEDGPNAGKIFPAIYELNGDSLRVCYDLSGAKRPAEFKTVPATALYLVTYQRAK